MLGDTGISRSKKDNRQGRRPLLQVGNPGVKRVGEAKGEVLIGGHTNTWGMLEEEWKEEKAMLINIFKC